MHFKSCYLNFKIVRYYEIRHKQDSNESTDQLSRLLNQNLRIYLVLLEFNAKVIVLK